MELALILFHVLIELYNNLELINQVNAILLIRIKLHFDLAHKSKNYSSHETSYYILYRLFGFHCNFL